MRGRCHLVPKLRFVTLLFADYDLQGRTIFEASAMCLRQRK
jgi:hypothetical protein